MSVALGVVVTAVAMIVGWHVARWRVSSSPLNEPTIITLSSDPGYKVGMVLQTGEHWLLITERLDNNRFKVQRVARPRYSRWRRRFHRGW